jgi:tetratricopeptide (TPR) repeat protein
MGREDREHASESMLERFFGGQLPPQETRKVVRHLLTGCPHCHEAAARISQGSGRAPGGNTGTSDLDLTGPPQRSETSASVFLDLLQEREGEAMRLARERLQGIGLLAELEKLPPGERLAEIRSNARFHHWGLFDRMLVKYPEAARNEPRAGIALVEQALAIVDLLPRERYKPELLNDFRAAGMAALANARRLAGFFEESKQAIESAWELLEDGTGDPLEEASLLSIEASLWRDLGRLYRSSRLLDRAIQIYRQIGDDNCCARMLIQKGLAVGYAEPARGIKILQDALSLLDAAQEPRLELCARHNLALFLDDSGESREALALLEMTRPLYGVFGDRQTQLLLHWLEARIARSFGDLAEAEAVLQKVIAELEQRGMRYEQALASIDLAQVYSLRGNFEAAVKLVNDFQPVLQEWGMHGEGQAMWMLFRDQIADHARMRVALEETAFRGIARYFHRAWHHPMRFEGNAPS